MENKKEVNRMTPTHPIVKRLDCTPHNIMPIQVAVNDFLIRLEKLKDYHKDWRDPKNQNRPFKPSYIKFVKSLVFRLPVTPEITPLTNGTIRLRFKKGHAPKDTWQCLDIVIHPHRYYILTAKPRIASIAPYTKTNLVRSDCLSDIIQKFYETDSMNTQEHPLRYRKATVVDGPAISAMCQAVFGPHRKYAPRRISKNLKYCIVADDPIYGIVSVAAIMRADESSQLTDSVYEVAFLATLQPYRGIGIVDKCLRKALTILLIDHPGVKVIAKSILADGQSTDNARSALMRSGFRKIKIVKGEKRYTNFDCDRCNLKNQFCNFLDPSSVCSTVYYELCDYGGKSGYGGKKSI